MRSPNDLMADPTAERIQPPAKGDRPVVWRLYGHHPVAFSSRSPGGPAIGPAPSITWRRASTPRPPASVPRP
ncbi:hypothetical protein [Streptosporangium sp. NPDC006007]|uniref:hypothetical protein n=1 Tax=Streptosporangium sp. NPDC006007 TaxID=3154575 RepID=UPI0033A61A5A